MNSFRSLVYLPDGANATSVFCRDSGLVQGDFATGIQTNVIVRSWMVKVKVRLLNLRVILAERALQGVPRLMRDLFGPSQSGPKVGHPVP